MFSGLLVCADCGCNLHFHFNQGNPEIKYFNCSNYKCNSGTCTSTCYVRIDFLEQVVLGAIEMQKVLPLSILQVAVNTRKGLFENDTPSELVV